MVLNSWKHPSSLKTLQLKPSTNSLPQGIHRDAFIFSWPAYDRWVECRLQRECLDSHYWWKVQSYSETRWRWIKSGWNLFHSSKPSKKACKRILREREKKYDSSEHLNCLESRNRIQMLNTFKSPWTWLTETCFLFFDPFIHAQLWKRSTYNFFSFFKKKLDRLNWVRRVMVGEMMSVIYDWEKQFVFLYEAKV